MQATATQDRSAEEKKLSVTIGIPAYNEERNTGYLLEVLQDQEETGFTIDEVIVVSDGSSDGTDKIVREFCKDHPRFKLMADGKRCGKFARMNELMQNATSDVIVILDADIYVEGKDLLYELLAPLLEEEEVVHTSGYALSLKPRTFAERVAHAGAITWEYVRRAPRVSYLYRSEGRIRAFRREMYEVLRFPDASADEAFSFLFGESRGFKFKVAEKALVRYRLPSNFSDYIKQMQRFLKSERIQAKEFDPAFVAQYYNIGLAQKFFALVQSWIRNPFWVTIYCCTLPIVRMLMIRDAHEDKDSGTWETVQSTKSLNGSLNKKNIIVSNYDDVENPHYAGGGAVAVHEIARRLSHEFNVTVLTGKYPGAKNEERNGVHYRRIGFSMFGGQIGQLLYHLTLPWYVMFLDYDIWIESFTPPFSTSFTPVFTKKPVVALVHMLSAQDMVRKYHLPFHWIENFGLKFYRHFIVVTKTSAEEVIAHNHSAEIKIIPNGVYMPTLNGERVGKHLSYIGRIEVDQKGIDLLLKAYKKISETMAVPLVIAGVGTETEMARVKKLIELHELGDSVHLLGRINAQEKENFFRETIACLLPSRFETFSLVALEMMSYGVPTVAFDIPGLQWITSNDAIIRVPSFDVDAMANAVLKPMQSSKLYQKTAQQARLYAEKYDWDSIAKEYEQFITDVITQKR